MNKIYKNEVFKKEKEINMLKEENKELGRKNAKGILVDEIMIELHNENIEKIKNLN
jgi:hypothetical protein